MGAVDPIECAVCGDPMKPGQRRDVLPDGRKAHLSCCEYEAAAEQRRQTLVGPASIADIMKVGEGMEAIDEAEARQRLEPIIAAIVDDRVAAAIEEATIEAIPNKSTQLRALLTDAAETLSKRLATERSYGKDLTLADIAAMVKARSLLQVLAVYVVEEP